VLVDTGGKETLVVVVVVVVVVVEVVMGSSNPDCQQHAEAEGNMHRCAST
jgi:hypothetical protein